MPITRLDHVNLQTTQLDVMVAWYDAVLGMKAGPRPEFPAPGAWLYIGETAAVHLSEVTETADRQGTLTLEHFALAATNLDAFLETLVRHEVQFEQVDLPAIQLVQVNVWDPDGNHIHVDFSTT